MKPSVAQIVHYVSYGTPGGEHASTCRAAIITEVDEYQLSEDGSFVGHVSLAVLNPTGLFFNRSVHYHDGEAAYKGGTWHWPERT